MSGQNEFLLESMMSSRVARTKGRDPLRVVAVGFLLLTAWILIRLFVLQVVRHSYFSLFALSSHEIYEKLHPRRGTIYFEDSRTKQAYPAAINKEYYLVYAVPKQIAPTDVGMVADRLASLLQLDATGHADLLDKLSQSQDLYRPIAHKVPEATMDQIKLLNLPGIFFSPEEYRYYPEGSLAAAVLGFVGFDNDGNPVGRYGVEGYWEKKIAGQSGYLMGERGALGSWVEPADRVQVAAENGADIVLTIDRALEYQACDRLQQGLTLYQAKSAALVMLDAKTGAVLAMCSLPNFDPNSYSKVADIADFNNTAVFTPYEPGSVFKAVTMAAGLDLGLVSPDTTYTDPCDLVINGYHVRNAEHKCYGVATMTQVLENSINTGAVWVEQKMGSDQFRSYVQKFGFGQKTGIGLDTEAAGDVSSLDRKGQIFGANGSFGQGLTATPLQIAAAYGAIANDGKLMRPYIVDTIQYASGQVERTVPQVADTPISPHASKLLSGMLVSVVENHYHAARLDHYYVAGKTGTAQIADIGGYSATSTNQTFAGFAPATNPKIVLVVKYEEPQRNWAEQTALPVFKDVMQNALNYYQIPADKK